MIDWKIGYLEVIGLYLVETRLYFEYEFGVVSSYILILGMYLIFKWSFE